MTDASSDSGANSTRVDPLPDPASRMHLELEKLRLDAQLRVEQMKQDVRKVIFGTMIVGVAAAFFPFAQELARSLFAERIESIKTRAEFARLQEQNRLAENLATAKHGLELSKQSAADVGARRDYLEKLAKEARSDVIETQIIAAEFFSFLGEPDMRGQWVAFREYLTNKQLRLNEERRTLLAKAGSESASESEKTSATERLQQIDRLQNPAMPTAVTGWFYLGKISKDRTQWLPSSALDDVNFVPPLKVGEDLLAQIKPGTTQVFSTGHKYLRSLSTVRGARVQGSVVATLKPKQYVRVLEIDIAGKDGGDTVVWALVEVEER